MGFLLTPEKFYAPALFSVIGAEAQQPHRTSATSRTWRLQVQILLAPFAGWALISYLKSHDPNGQRYPALFFFIRPSCPKAEPLLAFMGLLPRRSRASTRFGYGDVAQVGRALARRARGCGFKSRHLHSRIGPVAHSGRAHRFKTIMMQVRLLSGPFQSRGVA